MIKFNLFKLLILVSCITIFAIACKKEVKTENASPIENAKSWYIDHTANSRTALSASNDATESIATQFDWNNAITYNFSDGKEVIATPINMVKPNNKTIPGSFMLLVYKENNEYQSQMIYNQKDNYFGETASKSDVEASFMVAQKNKKLMSLAKSKVAFSNNANGKVMVAEVTPEVCTDWYWIIYLCDDEGNFLELIDEQYINTTCTGGDGNGNGVGDGTTPISINLNVEVIDSLINPCMKAAFSKFSDTKIKGFITNIYSKLYVGINSSVNLKIKQADNLTTQNSGSVPAYSAFVENSNTWEITLSNNYFTGSTYNMSQEAWAQIIVHELLHGIIFNDLPKINHRELDHAYIFKTYVDATKDFLMSAYGMSSVDALGLSLNGIRDLWGYSDFEALSISKYGLNNTQVEATFDNYTKGTGGSKCN